MRRWPALCVVVIYRQMAVILAIRWQRVLTR